MQAIPWFFKPCSRMRNFIVWSFSPIKICKALVVALFLSLDIGLRRSSPNFLFRSLQNSFVSNRWSPRTNSNRNVTVINSIGFFYIKFGAMKIPSNYIVNLFLILLSFKYYIKLNQKDEVQINSNICCHTGTGCISAWALRDFTVGFCGSW
jgi:hypothetical protein